MYRSAHAVRVRLRLLEAIATLAWHRRHGKLRGRPVAAIALVEHMGDIVAAEPLVQRAREAHPGASIVWIVGAPYAALPAAFDVDLVVQVECVAGWSMLARRVRFDHVHDLHLDGRQCIACKRTLVRTGRGAGVDWDHYYELGNLLAVESVLGGLPYVDRTPALRIDDAIRAQVDALRLPPSFIAVHCTSNDPAREWPRERWRRLIEALAQGGAPPVVEIGGRERGEAAGTHRSLCGKLSILESAEVIRRAALFIGADSGPAHLANAVGTAGVLLLGKWRHFDRYMPFSGRFASGGAAVLRAAGPAAELPVEDVLDAVWRRLAVS